MSRFCRPIDEERFGEGLALVRERIVGYEPREADRT